MDTEQKYQQTLEYLYGFVDYSLTHGSQLAAAHFELKRMQDFMAELGNPQLNYPVIHVAGTKGKGSVASLCASSLGAQGYRVGLYTSPHLYDYSERIQINGREISHAELVALVDEFRPYLDRGTELTTFEITTALAFLYFARQKVSVVVLEVGLGGRLDATNIITPLVSAITSISLDHTNILGNTLEAIAGEKAGIIKEGIPVVVAPQKVEAFQVIERTALQKSSPLVVVGKDYQYRLNSFSLDGQNFSVWHTAPQAKGEMIDLMIPLLGRHQVENAATAFAVLQTVNQIGLPVSLAAIRQGFAEVSWPGRFEVLQREPVVLVDSAHNRDSAQRLKVALQDYFPGKSTILVFGASEDKDIRGMLSELLPGAKRMVITRSFHPRAADPHELQKIAETFQCPTIIGSSVEEALQRALKLVDDDSIVLVTGSIFMAAEARHSWYNHPDYK